MGQIPACMLQIGRDCAGNVGAGKCGKVFIMLSAVLLFAVGLVLLIKGGDWFVDGATGIAHRFHMPDLLIGATVVSIGTTLPEVMVSATSAVSGHGEIAYGNAIGSIICNTALIAAITIAVRPQSVNQKTLRTPVLFFFIAAIFYSAIAYIGGSFNRMEGVIFLLIFAVYMVVTVRQMTGPQGPSDALPGEAACASESEGSEDGDGAVEMTLVKEIGLLVVGAVLIAVGADLLVDNGTIIATGLGVPESVIALTIVALGTSLPELVTAITSLAKGHGSLSLGNVIGANLFNLVLVNGVSVTLSPFDVPVSKTLLGMNSSLLVDIPLMLFVMAFLTIPALVRGRLSRVQGIVLLCIYAGFCVYQFL